jgi:hypothetical protein
MATSGKNRRGDRGRGHLIDVSEPADPRGTLDGWLTDPASSTQTQQTRLATSGQVEIWIDPEEYEEFSRQKQNQVAPDRDALAADPEIPPADTDGDGGPGVAAFMAQITPAPAADSVDAVEGEDAFLSQFTQTSERPRAQPTRPTGSAALEGAAAAPGHSRRSLNSRQRVRSEHRRRWVGLAAVVVVLAGVASVVLQSHTPSRTRHGASATSPARLNGFADFSARVIAANREVSGVARTAVSHERTTAAGRQAAAARRMTARKRADHRRAVAAADAARTRTRHRTPAAAHSATSITPSQTTASSVNAATQTVTVAAPATTSSATPPPPTQSTTSPKTSTPTSSTTTTRAYGQGGVLGAGHSSGSS